jgi:hypothetical protein
VAKQSSHRIYHAVYVSFWTGAPDPNFSGLLAQLFREVDGYHQNRGLRREVNDAPRCVQPIHLGHLEIDDNEIGFGFLEPLDRLFAIASLITNLPIVVMIQQAAKASSYSRVVVRYQDSNQTALQSSRESWYAFAA